MVGLAALDPSYNVVVMADYRRNYVAGGTYFFTVVTYQRRGFLTDGPETIRTSDLVLIRDAL